MLPLRHRLCVVGREQTTAREDAQPPPAHALLHLRDGVAIEVAGGMEDHSLRRRGLEYTVDDHAVEVQDIQRGAKAMNEGDRAQTRRGTRAWAARALAGLHGA
jgi:hypothetical protein